MVKQRWGLDKNGLIPTPGDPCGVEQHHWNTGANGNQQLNPAKMSRKLSISILHNLKRTTENMWNGQDLSIHKS